MTRPNVIESGIRRPTARENVDKAAAALCQSLREYVEETLDGIDCDAEQCLAKLRKFIPTERLLTTNEAAAYLKVQPQTLRDWCAGGLPKLPFIQLGTERRFRLSELEHYLESRTFRPKEIKL